jgi:mRNA-degrading endonuclease RelE of RelBE toxin-antitoxin system
MVYTIKIKRKIEKKLNTLPILVQKKLGRLVLDLRDKGPEQHGWPNYCKLSQSEYHCHLGYSWVACWENEKNTILIEVYYVGSREKAPY